jgi:hypothetical protein
VSKLTAAEQVGYSVQVCAAKASEILCKGLVIPALDPSVIGSPNSAMLTYAATCLARRRHDVVIFAPAPAEK